MKGLVVALALFLMAVVAANAHVPGGNLDRTQVSGSDYVRVADWADAEGFHMKWAKNAGTVLLTNHSAKLQLTIDSRRVEIRGVNVWLSLPVVNRGGVPMISAVDAATTLEPILFPQPLDTSIHTICIDPGHGGKDKGFSDGQNFEKKYALLLARDVEELLKRDGLQVVLTRDSDYYVDLPERSMLAKREKADVFVSLHYNAAPQHDVRGLEVYCLAPAGMNSSSDGGGKAPFPPLTGNAHDHQNALLAYEILKSVTSGLPVEDRGVKRSRFEVLRDAGMPAILIEGGFMTNPADAKNIFDATFRKRMAQAIADGILAYGKAIAGSDDHRTPPSGLNAARLAAAPFPPGHQ
jgi:N-acetylmuramoyl-L-alanine amidase